MPTEDDPLVDDLAADALSTLIPFGGTIGKRLMRPLRAEWGRNLSEALRAAEQVSGLKREDLAEWIESDPRSVPLYLQVLWAAGMNGHDKTLRAMGAVFGHAAKAAARHDEDAFEDAQLALQAMRDLGARHFTVLGVLNDGQVVVDDAGRTNLGQFVPAYVADKTGLRTSVTHQCLVNLAGAGLADTVSAFGSLAYPITQLGRAVVQAARMV
jgi:hypothetical protein